MSSACMKLAVISVVLVEILFIGNAMPNTASADEPDGKQNSSPLQPFVLLVGGMTYDLANPLPIWGERIAASSESSGESPTYTGMLGALVREGYRYGGTVTTKKGRMELPEALAAATTDNASTQPNLFVLEFSDSARIDGLGIKALELAECLKELRRATGRPSAQIVAHSAGGIVARTYLQSALPGIRYAGDVRSLITIGTPHLGSDLATHLGDWLGTRATSLMPGAPLIRQLNEELDLPAEVRFAAIVVRGLGADLKGEGSAYDELLDRKLLESLPLDYRRGGDQIVHVRSQNLALASCARRYELVHRRPVQYLAVRVEDPSPQDSWPCQTTVHEVSPGDASVQSAVQAFLTASRDDDAGSASTKERNAAIGMIHLLHARCRALSAVEAGADGEHPCCQVVSSSDLAIGELRSEADRITASFTGTARSRGPFRVFTYTTKPEINIAG
ncbi:MAG: hypothetical protein K8U03_21130 [Planctomycetia bacterium]|nr:hypothetical protein [Planctomycetia bacterium]